MTLANQKFPACSLPCSPAPATSQCPERVRWIQATPCRPAPLRCIIISYRLRLGLPSGRLPSGFPTKTVFQFSSPPVVPHAPIILSSLLWSPESCLTSHGSRKAQRYVVLSSPLLLYFTVTLRPAVPGNPDKNIPKTHVSTLNKSNIKHEPKTWVYNLSHRDEPEWNRFLSYFSTVHHYYMILGREPKFSPSSVV
jgi:hypothetical protein